MIEQGDNDIDLIDLANKTIETQKFATNRLFMV
jgi:hypothetical protein